MWWLPELELVEWLAQLMQLMLTMSQLMGEMEQLMLTMLLSWSLMLS